MRVFGSYPWGACNQRRSQSRFTLLPTRVNSGARSPPTRFPAAFWMAWQEEQNKVPYKLVPACTASSPCGGAALFNSLREFSEAVLCATKKDAISAASWSLNRKFGIVDDAAYACGFLIHAKIHSRVVFSATCSKDGGSSTGTMSVPS